MNESKADNLIKISALVVGGVYLYRRFTEGTAEELKASQTIAPLGRFVIGWGIVFFSLSVIASTWPGLAGELAILIMISTLLINGKEVSKDISTGLGSRHRPVTTQAQHGHEEPTSGTTRTSPIEPARSV